MPSTRRDVALADGLRGELGVEPTGSAIVSVGGDDLESALAARGIKAATRASGCRLSFHLYNDEDDVAAAVAAASRRRPRAHRHVTSSTGRPTTWNHAIIGTLSNGRIACFTRSGTHMRRGVQSRPSR